ncbi:MAG: HIT domain-containing protein [Peptococcaceae bacterium]
MNRLWAPWRSEYVGKESPSGCIFCAKLQDNNSDEDNYVLLRAGKVFVMLNLYPYTNGHLLVIPKRHVGELTALEQEEAFEIFQLTQKFVQTLKLVFKPEGFNIGANLGKVAGAGVPDHFHVHIVPRWQGDTNFMTAINNTRVISEELKVTYRKLKETIKNI